MFFLAVRPRRWGAALSGHHDLVLALLGGDSGGDRAETRADREEVSIGFSSSLKRLGLKEAWRPKDEARLKIKYQRSMLAGTKGIATRGSWPY